MINSNQPDLVVLSHLRWIWVWQRPQHLVARLADLRAEDGARTWFVEEPTVGDVDEPVLRQERHGNVTRVWLVVPRTAEHGADVDRLDYQCTEAAGYGAMVAQLLASEGRPTRPDLWFYTPMAFDLAQSLDAGRVAYDIMDDLSSFRNAPVGLALRQRRLLAEADIVFTGGRSLHRFAASQRQRDIHLFPSGVETAHYATARRMRSEMAPRRTPVAGYVGVIDERLDLELIRELAGRLPGWTIRMVGPVAKIDRSSLPQRENVAYVGMRSYADLPEVMAGFDVALMPFALNEATRSISPTKSLEYLAAGLPIVSTRVPDVVADYATLVHLAEDAPEFADACEAALREDAGELERRARRVLVRQEWDTITARMVKLLDATASPFDAPVPKLRLDVAPIHSDAHEQALA